MKLRIFLCFALLLCALLSSTHIARAEVIRNLDVVIRAQKDGALDITETTVIDFGKEPNYGIFRWFPLETEPGSKKFLKIQLLGATHNGKKTPTQVSIKDHKWNVDIGGTEVSVTGVQTYAIRYKVQGAMLKNGEKPFVSWTATPEWSCPIRRATVRFYPPPGIDARHLPARADFGTVTVFRRASLMRWRRSLLWYAHNMKPDTAIGFEVTLPAGSMRTN